MLILSRPPKARHVSDFINWGIMAESGVIITKQAELASVFRYVPRDLASSSPEQLLTARCALNKSILRFGKGWALWFEAQRYESKQFDQSMWPDQVSNIIDGQRRKLFTGNRTQHSTDHFLTVLYSPPDDAVGALAAQFEHANADDRSSDARIQNEFDTFARGLDELYLHLAAFMPDIYQLHDGELLAYLRNTISTRRRHVNPEPFPIYVAEALAEEEFLGGRKPMLGNHHLRTIRINGMPSHTEPGIFGALETIDFPYRRVARWIPMSRTDAKKEIELRKQEWKNRRTPLLRQMVSHAFRKTDDGSRDNLSADLAMIESDKALIALASSDFTFGYWSNTITLTHESPVILDERCKTVQQIIESRGFGAPIAFEDAQAVWVGSLPMHPHGDLGRFLGCSMTFADLLPATAVWEGPERDEHLNGPPLMRGISDGGTPFRLALHQPGSDVGHTLIIGATGSGKSVLLSAMIAGYRRYPHSRVVIIDRGASSKVLTLALGGCFHALTAEHSSVSLQPFAHIDEPSEQAWASDYLLGILEHEGLNPTPDQKSKITYALARMAKMPRRQRTFTHLQALIQDSSTKLALATFCLGGANGDLLDNDEERLGIDSDVICYETAALMDRHSAAGPVLAAMFHAIERQLDGSPTMLIIDEAWAALDHPIISSKLRDWLKTFRKKNVQVILATQSLADIEARPELTAAVAESCRNRIFTANDRAMERASAETLSRFGLLPEQIKIISELRPKTDYAFSVAGMWRSFELRLSPVELAFIGKSRPNHIAAADRIVREHGGEFARYWLDYCGFSSSDVDELLGPEQMFSSAAE